MTEEQIEQALAKASAYQLAKALREHHGAYALSYWQAEDVMYEVEGATKEQAEDWLLDYEDSIAEIVGEAFYRVLDWNRDEIEVQQTKEQED